MASPFLHLWAARSIRAPRAWPLARCLVVAMSLLVLLPRASATTYSIEDGFARTQNVFTGGDRFNMDTLVNDAVASSNAVLHGCTFSGVVTVSCKENSPDLLVTALTWRIESSQFTDGCLFISRTAPNVYFAVSDVVAKVTANVNVLRFSPLPTPENVTIVLEGVKVTAQTAVTDSGSPYLFQWDISYEKNYGMGIHNTLHFKNIEIMDGGGIWSNHGRVTSTFDLEVKQWMLIAFDSIICVRCRRPLVDVTSVVLYQHSALLFRGITSVNSRVMIIAFLACDWLRIYNSSLLLIADVTMVNGFRLTKAPFFTIRKGFHGPGSITLMRVTMHTSGLTRLMPTDTRDKGIAQFWISARVSPGAVLTYEELRRMNFNVNSRQEVLNWETGEAGDGYCPRSLGIASTTWHQMGANGQCTHTCIPPARGAACTKPYEDPCLVDKCSLCYRNSMGPRSVCYVCDEGTYKANNERECRLCPPNCESCTANECKRCDDQYSLSDDHSTCIECRIANCRSCTFANKCSGCADGSSHSADKTACYPCSIANCTTCFAPMQCAVCAANMTASVSGGACSDCQVKHCNYCESSGVCRVCECGMVPTAGGDSCVPCRAEHCVYCTAPGDGSLCDVCESGYKSSNGVCEEVGVPSYLAVLLATLFTALVAVAVVGGVEWMRHRRAKKVEEYIDA